jgi:hypothetical protein
MYFQTLDDKSECVGIYKNGELYFENFPSNLKKTWKYTGSMDNEDIEYAWLMIDGKSLHEVAPDDLIDELKKVDRKMNAFYKSFKIAKINFNEHCIFDLIPIDSLMEFCEIKNKITRYVFENFTKPDSYNHLNEVQKLLHKIKYQKLNLNSENCRHLFASTSNRKKITELMKNYNYIDYNLFGTVTGRLTTRPNSFPVLTIKKEFRSIIKPNNDLFISLDYNGAEIRTLLELCDQPQPDEDIHQWNAKHLFEQEIEREEAKVRFFAWLYDPNSNDIKTDYYDREKVLEKWYDGKHVTTRYGRKIKVEERKAFNYLIQSTTADRVLEKAVKIDKFLSCYKSYISHVLHDEIVIDFCDDERDMIVELRNIFEDGYKSSIRGGKDYYNLSELKI